MKIAPAGLMFLLLTTLSTTLWGQDYPQISESQRLKMLDIPANRPTRMVLDTDTFNEIDDQFAVVYALISPELDVQAIYAAPFHNSRSSGPGDGMEKSYEEIERILSRLDRSPQGFAHKGSTRYLDLAQPEESPATRDLIKRAQASSPEDPLYVVAVGCITNISNAILLEPSIIGKIVVVWLGGNGRDWPHQREFNYRQDLPHHECCLIAGCLWSSYPARPSSRTSPPRCRKWNATWAAAALLAIICSRFSKTTIRTIVAGPKYCGT